MTEHKPVATVSEIVAGGMRIIAPYPINALNNLPIGAPLYDASLLSEYESVKREEARASASLTGILQSIKHHSGFDHGIMGIRSLVDRAEAAEAEAKRLADERYRLAYAITGGEDAPGLLDSVAVEELEKIQRDTVMRHNGDIDRLMALEAKAKRLREALVLISNADIHLLRSAKIARAALEETR